MWVGDDVRLDDGQGEFQGMGLIGAKMLVVVAVVRCRLDTK